MDFASWCSAVGFNTQGNFQTNKSTLSPHGRRPLIVVRMFQIYRCRSDSRIIVGMILKLITLVDSPICVT